MTDVVPQKAGLVVLLEERGPDWVLDQFCTSLADGVNPLEFCEKMGISWWGLKGWMEIDSKRMEQMLLAKRCYADKLAWESMEIADEATPDDVAVKKLQGDRRVWLASKLDRAAWGDAGEEKKGFASGGVTIVIGEVRAKEDVSVTVEGEKVVT